MKYCSLHSHCTHSGYHGDQPLACLPFVRGLADALLSLRGEVQDEDLWMDLQVFAGVVEAGPATCMYNVVCVGVCGAGPRDFWWWFRLGSQS